MTGVLEARQKNDDLNPPSQTQPWETRVHYLLDEPCYFKGYLLHTFLSS
jgi:hypothetical protein